jgi:hypothetical protein
MSLKGPGSFTNRDGPGPGTYVHKTMFESIGGAATFGKNRRIQDVINKTMDGGSANSKSMA